MRRTRGAVLATGLILLIITIALTSCALSPTLPPETQEGLVILSHSTYVDSSGYCHIVGEVENRGQNNTRKNKVIATFYDEQGASNLTALCYCYLEILKPGERSPFEIVLSSPPNVVNYMLTVEWEVTDTELNRDIVPGELEAMTDGDGYYVVTGQTTNNTGKPIDVIMIVGSFYDSEGTIVAAGITFADVAPLQPDESANFTMVIDPSISSKISTYSLQLVAYN
jgi:hypothetical protein